MNTHCTNRARAFGRSWKRTDSDYFVCQIERKTHYLHRWIWEKENGVIPEGYQIHHIDEDKDNNDIENLQCLHISDHMKIHCTDRNIGNEYFKGKHHSEETKKSISKKLKGRTFSSEHRENISKARLGNGKPRHKEGETWFQNTKRGKRWFKRENGINVYIGYQKDECSVQIQSQ